jgi:diguanylate cyclase (GGDEF)-like protein
MAPPTARDVAEDAELEVIEEADITAEFTAGAAAPSAGPCWVVPALFVVMGREFGQLITLDAPETTIGRSATAADVCLDSDQLSRAHAKIIARDGRYFVRDLDSRNGTYLNDTRFTGEVPLKAGDAIRLGAGVILQFGFRTERTPPTTSGEVPMRDALTGAWNERVFEERLRAHWTEARARAMPCTVALVEAHAVGRLANEERALAEVSAVAGRIVRTGDTFARLGGSRFGIVPSAPLSLAATATMGERLRAAVEAHGKEGVTISVGVSTSSDGCVSTPEQLVARAAECLERAQRAGGNRVEW